MKIVLLESDGGRWKHRRGIWQLMWWWVEDLLTYQSRKEVENALSVRDAVNKDVSIACPKQSPLILIFMKM